MSTTALAIAAHKKLSASRALLAATLVFILLSMIGGDYAMANTEVSANVSANSKDSQEQAILVVGDSISAAYGMNTEEGWVHLLKNKLAETGYSHTVINGSISGNTTGDGLDRLPQLLKVYTPEIVILELGGNDGLRGYPVKIMAKNLQTMINLSQAIGARVLLAGIEIPPNYGERYTSAFRNTFQTIARNNPAIIYLPFILENVATNPLLMQKDGIHPTATAQPQLLQNVWDKLQPMLQ